MTSGVSKYDPLILVLGCSVMVMHLLSCLSLYRSNVPQIKNVTESFFLTNLTYLDGLNGTGSNLELSRKRQLQSMPTAWMNSSSSAAEEDNIKDDVIRQFFLTAEEERSYVSGGNAVGFAQPVNLSGAVFPSFSSSSPSLCFQLKPSTTQRGHAPSCRKARDLRYTSVRPNWLFSDVFSCGDPFDVPERTGCVKGFDGFLPVLQLKGPSFIFARTSHLPHFLEEVADAANWLARNNISFFEHVLIDISGYSCQVFDSYHSGSWMPTGSPLAATLQIAMLKTITRGIVFSWTIRDGRTVCLDRPWRRPGITRDAKNPAFFQKGVCSFFRRKLLGTYGVVEQPSMGVGIKVVVLQRSSSRVVTNLGDLSHHSDILALNLTLRYVSLGQGPTTTAESQFREFSDADILISHHGAGITLAALMKPGGLVLELFNYNCKCKYFDDLVSSCGLHKEQLFNPNGKKYSNQCNGNNKKDHTDDGQVDIKTVATSLRNFLQSKMLRGVE